MILIREEDRQQAEQKRKRLLALYIVVACVYAATALLLLFLSPDAYKPYMAATIVITIAFGCYSVFFFSVQFDVISKRYRLLDKVINALPEKEYGVFLQESDPLTFEGIEMRVFRFLIKGDERDVHLTEGSISPKEGRTYLLEIRAGVLTEIGEKNEETVC